MYQFFDALIADISGFLYSYLLIILLLAVGLYFTIRTRGIQFRLLPKSLRLVGGKNSVSAFEALMVSTASRVGTGNIVGVAGAIAVGGPGAVFWMWLIAFFGMMTNYSENVLGILYRRKNSKGEWCGGAMYYLKDGLGGKKGCKQIGIQIYFATVILTHMPDLPDLGFG